MAIYSSIVTFFQNGGAFMYPIVLILALGTAIAVERWVFLTDDDGEEQGAVELGDAVLEVRQPRRRDAASRASPTLRSARS